MKIAIQIDDQAEAKRLTPFAFVFVVFIVFLVVFVVSRYFSFLWTDSSSRGFVVITWRTLTFITNSCNPDDRRTRDERTR